MLIIIEVLSDSGANEAAFDGLPRCTSTSPARTRSPRRAARPPLPPATLDGRALNVERPRREEYQRALDSAKDFGNTG